MRWTGKSADILSLIDDVACANLRCAVNTGHARAEGISLPDSMRAAAKRLGAVLVSAPRVDVFGQSYDSHAPAHSGGVDLRGLAQAGSALVVLDAVYGSVDDEYLDIVAVEKAFRAEGGT